MKENLNSAWKSEKGKKREERGEKLHGPGDYGLIPIGKMRNILKPKEKRRGV